MKPVLIVDDEIIMRESLREWLTEGGYQVEIAQQGQEALKAIKERDFGLLILDIRLPGKNGLEVLKEARAYSPQIKGIIITAYPTVETAVEAMKVGAIDYLTKPFQLNELEKVVQETLGPVQLEVKPKAVIEELAIQPTTVEDTKVEEAIIIAAMIIGNTVKVMNCTTMPEIVGEQAEIVDMQIEEFDRYSTYPVWARITTGESKGKVYGFKYEELEVLDVITVNLDEATLMIKIMQELEEFLDSVGEHQKKETTIRVGAPVRIISCAAIPEVVGECTEIVDIQIQEFDSYAVFPVWGSVTTGKHKGKTYGFHYEELKVLPTVTSEKISKEGAVERLEQMLRTIRVGSMVKVKGCDLMSELTGEKTCELNEAISRVKKRFHAS